MRKKPELRLCEAYLRVLNGASLASLSCTDRTKSCIQSFRPFETKSMTAADISRKAEIPRSTARDLRHVYSQFRDFQGSVHGWPENSGD